MEEKKVCWFLLAVKISLITSSFFIIFLSILTDTKVINHQAIEKCKIGWPFAVFAGLLYSITPFSAKQGIWSSVWAIIISCLAFYFIMAISLQTQSWQNGQFYLLLLPHLLTLIAAIGWLILTSLIIKNGK